MDYMTQAEFARLMNVSRKTVTAWKARGWVKMDADGLLVDVQRSVAYMRKYRPTGCNPQLGVSVQVPLGRPPRAS
jgi:hypothetical protein